MSSQKGPHEECTSGGGVEVTGFQLNYIYIVDIKHRLWNFHRYILAIMHCTCMQASHRNPGMFHLIKVFAIIILLGICVT